MTRGGCYDITQAPALNPTGGGAYVLSVIGGIGDSLTLLNYNYLLRDEGKVSADELPLRRDLALAYAFTAVFGIAIILIASRPFYATVTAITGDDAASRTEGDLGKLIGPIGR